MQSSVARLPLPLRRQRVNVSVFAQPLHDEPPPVSELHTEIHDVRNIIDQDDVAFRIASSPRSEAGHRLSRLAIDNDVLSLGLLVQRVGLLNENSIRLAEYEELMLRGPSIVDELGLSLHQRMHSLHSKAVDVDTILEELLWQVKSIMMFQLDFL